MVVVAAGVGVVHCMLAIATRVKVGSMMEMKTKDDDISSSSSPEDDFVLTWVGQSGEVDVEVAVHGVAVECNEKDIVELGGQHQPEACVVRIRTVDWFAVDRDVIFKDDVRLP